MDADTLLEVEDSNPLRRLAAAFDGVPCPWGNLTAGEHGSGGRSSDDAAADLTELGWDRVRPVSRRHRRR